MSPQGEITLSRQPAETYTREVASHSSGNIPTVMLDALSPTIEMAGESHGLNHELAGRDPNIYSNIVSMLGLTALKVPTSTTSEIPESTAKGSLPSPASHLSPHPHPVFTPTDTPTHTTTPSTPSTPSHTTTPSPRTSTALFNITNVVSTTAWVNATTLMTSTRTVDPLAKPNNFSIHHEKTKRIPVWAIALTSTVLSLLFLAVIIMLGYRGVRKWQRRLHDRYAREAWAQTQKIYHREPELGLNIIRMSTSDLQSPPKVYTPPPKYPGRLERRGARFNPLGNVKGHTTSDEVNNPLTFISRTATRGSDSRSAPAAMGLRSMHSFDTFSSDELSVTVGSEGSRLGSQRGFRRHRSSPRC